MHGAATALHCPTLHLSHDQQDPDISGQVLTPKVKQFLIVYFQTHIPPLNVMAKQQCSNQSQAEEEPRECVCQLSNVHITK